MPDLSPSPSSAASPALSPSATSQPAEREGLRSRPLRLALFNQLDRDDAIELVRPCLSVERWWTAVVDARPYANQESLLDTARRAADPLTRPELTLAVAGYLDVRADDWLPGDPDTIRYGADASAATIRAQIADQSVAYLARFGRPFVIRTAGRSTSDVAEHLQQRLGHDLATEDWATAAALRQIGLLSLVRRVAT